MTCKIENVYLRDSVVVAGKLEYAGPIATYLDYMYKEKNLSFEDEEIEMLFTAIDLLMEKLKLTDEDISLAIGGELSNQLTTSSYTLRRFEIPFLGLYAACSTITEAIGLASLLLQRADIDNILVFTSSYNQSAERQFRNPVEYGGGHENTQTSTSTIASSAILSKKKTSIKISMFTPGRVIDVDFKNSMDFGRAMAPAAIETLLEHFENTKTTPNDYDLILTGDLSYFGYNVVLRALKDIYGVVTNYMDCGLILYDIKKQNVLAGGSGPGTVASVLLSYIKKEMLKKKYKKVILCATGILMNPCMILQKNSLPAISHLIVLEVEE